MRTSSISPEKYSPHTELPPMRNTPLDCSRLPVSGLLPTWTPLTNNRSVVQSYVAARWVHVFSGIALVPIAN